jgi:hypothetical protein
VLCAGLAGIIAQFIACAISSEHTLFEPRVVIASFLAEAMMEEAEPLKLLAAREHSIAILKASSCKWSKGKIVELGVHTLFSAPWDLPNHQNGYWIVHCKS